MARPTQRLERRLSRTEKNELIQAYRDGASTAELARRYRASKSAILELLTKGRVPRRYQSMTEADIDRAEQLYLVGHSLSACAKLTGFPASSINRALNNRGTPMRPAGRPRTAH
ncbi:helix-turn-helix domain-containing protein [Nocardia yunnanensis]|uniref:Helix-turn-helix domain-containing protein n=1 Tax=Nocardia yunnanensis TaxID=2382165 RepID=A0A386ZMB4_9NOCA|nr:helix-turn-helix domain-containing protein [Nocardia yunnanensis]AYF78463.1 helix-turn-helix domain-containing protein [Nocardia yunnanensis]